MVLNAEARAFGDAAIAAMGYVGRTSNMVFSVGLGIGQGFQPVSGFNYGAKKFSRVRRGAWFTLAFGIALMGTLAAVCFAFAPGIISLFRDEPEVLAIGGEALRVHCVFILFLPVSVVATMLFQSTGQNLPAFVLSCMQSGAVFIPLCILLPHAGNLGVRGIEIAQPLAYMIAAAASFPVMLRFLNRLPEDE